MSQPEASAADTHLWFLRSLDRVNRAIQGAHDLDAMMRDALEATLTIFACDRAWLLYPCDPEAPTWRVPMECTRPEYPGAFALGIELPVDATAAAVFRTAMAAGHPVSFGPGSDHPLPDAARQFDIASQILMAVYPRVDRPYLFGLHQCSYARVWTPNEARLFEAIGRRIADGLDTLISFRRVQESERSLALFRSLIDRSNDSIEVIDPDTGRFLDVNEQACRALGYTRDEYLALSLRDVDTLLARMPHEVMLAELHRPGVLVVEREHRRKDGSVFPVEVNATHVRLDRDYRVAVVRDISERKAAERALRQSEASHRSLAENTPDYIVRWDRDLRRVYVNPAFARATGLRAEDVAGTAFGTMYAPTVPTEALAPVVAGIRSVFETGRPTAMYSEWVTLDGPAVHFLRLVPECDPDGTVRTVLGIARDVTALKESERQFRTLAEHSPDAIIRFDREARYRYANPALERMTAVPVERFIGRRYGEVYASMRAGAEHAASVEFRNRILAVGDTGEPFDGETTFPMIPGRVFNVRLIPEADDAGSVATVLMVARDVTERARALEALRASEERFRQVTEAMDEVFWLAEAPTGALIYVSPAYDRLFGRTRDELLADPDAWLGAVHHDDRPRVEDAAASKELGTYDIEYRIVRADGTTRWVHERAFPIHDRAGRVYRVAGVAEDVTRRRELEEQLRQSQKMDALGQLAGGVAHDFNNMLAVIQLQSTLLLDVATTPDLREGIEQILGATERASNLTRQLLTFSRREVMQAVPLDVGQTVGNLVKLLRRVLGEDVALETRFAASLPLVHADPGMMEQVLMNLVINARDAMPRGGRLTIALDAVAADACLAALHDGSAAGPFVCLTIRDTGCGIAPEHLPRIFEPFFTTKEAGRGTGLGLATVFGIVRQHRGWVEVDSVVGGGTTFRVFLPALACAREAATTAPPTEVRGGDETILLVEDEWTVRSLTRAVLQRYGYRVVEADSASAALRAWDEHRGTFDLLVTDVIMPGGMSGLDLAETLRRTSPRLRVIYTSGYTPDVVGRVARPDANLELLRKPFGALELAQRVRQVLDEGAVAAPPPPFG